MWSTWHKYRYTTFSLCVISSHIRHNCSFTLYTLLCLWYVFYMPLKCIVHAIFICVWVICVYIHSIPHQWQGRLHIIFTPQLVSAHICNGYWKVLFCTLLNYCNLMWNVNLYEKHKVIVLLWIRKIQCRKLNSKSPSRVEHGKWSKLSRMCA